MEENNNNMPKNVNDHLKEYLEKNDYSNGVDGSEMPASNHDVQSYGPNTKMKVTEIQADSNYISVELNELPFGRFYEPGTRISVRPLKTVELESFAIVNENNAYDVKLKLNDVLRSCSKVVSLKGSHMSNRDIMDGDRDTITILLSRLSKKHGAKLERETKHKCQGMGNSFLKLDMIPANYAYKQEDPKLTKWFDPDTRIYNFKLKSGAFVPLAPPTTGLSEDIDNYILYKAAKSGGNETPNITFMKCIPYVLAGRGIKQISIDKLEQEEFNFTKLNDEVFQFIFTTVDLISFGIEELKSKCPYCGEEVTAPFGFPKGARALFMLSNAFDELIG